MPTMTGKAAERAAIFRTTVLPLVRSRRDAGMTLRAIADDLNARSVKTLNGRCWAASTVRALLLRSESRGEASTPNPCLAARA